MKNKMLEPCPACGLGYVIVSPATRPEHGSAYDLGCRVCKVPEHFLVVPLDQSRRTRLSGILRVIDGGAQRE